MQSFHRSDVVVSILRTLRIIVEIPQVMSYDVHLVMTQLRDAKFTLKGLRIDCCNGECDFGGWLIIRKAFRNYIFDLLDCVDRCCVYVCDESMLQF